VDLRGLFDHGYLAVDLFFLLSGFVIERAYGGRIASGELNFREFVSVRVIRLLPMIVFGTILAAAIDVFRRGDFAASEHYQDIVITGLLGLVLLPVLWKTTLEDSTYPLNGPAWSLFFELAANFLYAPLRPSRHNKTIFLVLTLLSILIIAKYSFSFGTHDIQFGTFRVTLLLGFPRVFASFFLGVLLARYEFRVRPVSRWVFAGVLFCILACPRLPDRSNPAFDLLMICFVFPFLVLGAAQCNEAQQKSALAKWSGDTSYPLYMIHYPLVRVVATLVRQLDSSAIVNLLLASGAAAVFALIASVVSTTYEVVARRWLKQRYKRWTTGPIVSKDLGARGGEAN